MADEFNNVGKLLLHTASLLTISFTSSMFAFGGPDLYVSSAREDMCVHVNATLCVSLARRAQCEPARLLASQWRL